MEPHGRRASSRQTLSKLEGVLKPRYLGIGFVWAWIYGSYETYAVFPERSGIGINADASWVFSAGTVVLVLLFCGLLFRYRPIPHEREVGLVASLLVAAGTVLSAFTPQDTLQALPCLCVSGLFTGVGSGLLYLLWAQVLSRLDEETAEMAAPAASVAMILCALVLPYLRGYVGIAATASLPLLSGIMLLLTIRDLPLEEGFAHSRVCEVSSSSSGESIPSSFIRIAALLFLSYLAIGCSGALSFNTDTPLIVFGIDLPTIIGSCCGIALMFCFVFFAARPSFDSLFKLIAPLLVAALVLLPWGNIWAVFLSESFISAADMILQIATLLFVVKAAQRGMLGAAAGFGLCQGAAQLGVLFGNMAGSGLAVYAASSDSALPSIALALAAVVSLSWFVYPAERPLPKTPATTFQTLECVERGEMGTSFARAQLEQQKLGREGAALLSEAVGDEAALAKGLEAPSQVCQEDGARDSLLDNACMMLAAECGLSPRETEVLTYLAHGRSQPYIRETLVLSKNTVATHVKHIYQKLDIHSRQELIDLVEGKAASRSFD